MTQLSEIDSLFSRSWHTYEPRMGYYALLTLVTSLIYFGIIVVLLTILFAFSIDNLSVLGNWMTNFYRGEDIPMPPIGNFIQIGVSILLLIITSWFLHAWMTAALWMAVTAEHKLAIGEVLQRAIPLTPRYVLLNFLSGFIVNAGLILFIAPGILFLGWFTFANITAQKHATIQALKTSRTLVMGHWWAIVGRIFLAVILAFIVPQIIIMMMTSTIDKPSTYIVGPIITIILTLAIAITRSFFLTPWYMTFKNSLYQDALGEPQL